MATFTEIRTAIDALYSDPALSRLGAMAPGTAEALLYLIASGGKLQTGVSPAFAGDGRFPKTESECQIRLPAKSRLVSFLCFHNSGQDLYFQAHNKATDLVVGDIPAQGFSIDLGNPGGAAVTVGDHGSSGRSFGDDPIIAISTKRGTYSPPAATALVVNGDPTVSITWQVVA